MFERPEALPDAAVVDALRDGWGLDVDAIEHLPVGFGGHHWRVGSAWFVTADDLERRPARLATLRAALGTARALHTAGLDFVVAPVPTSTGDVVQLAAGDRFAVSLYEHVDGEAHAWGAYSPALRAAVLDRVVAVHRATEHARGTALVDDLAVEERDELVLALDDLRGPWDAGPYGEQARDLLARHAGAVVDALGRYDQLAASVGPRSDRFVVTHGEPHPGNTMTTAGGLVLVDWDTALLAPPERDLWTVADGDESVLDRYEAATGVAPDPEALALYRSRWDLGEVGIGAALFRRPHGDDEDTRMSWSGFRRYVAQAVTPPPRGAGRSATP